NRVLCSCVIVPLPWQRGQVFSPKPPFPLHFEQVSTVSISTSQSQPIAASIKEILTLVKISLPLLVLLLFLLLLPPKNELPPNKSSNISPRSLASKPKPVPPKPP